MPLTRRNALRVLGAGGLSLYLAPRSAASSGRNGPGLEELAHDFRSTSRSEVFDAGADAIRAGANLDVFLGAVFLAGVTDVRPRPHGILHCVMVVESSFQLAERSAGREAWLPALWNLDDFKRSQSRDRSEDGDWKLEPLSAAEGVAGLEPAARREFESAMRAWDAERAEKALVRLLHFHSHASFFEILWPLALRCYAFIGHKIIYAVQIERVLARIGWRHAEPALRSLVHALLTDRDTDDFEACLPFASGELLKDGPADREASLTFLARMRTADPNQARELVWNARGKAVSEQAIWDALRLFGSELFHRRPGRTAASRRNALLPVHGVTVAGALGYVRERSSEPRTRCLATLVAASWLARMRDDLQGMVGLAQEGFEIDKLSSETLPEPAELRARLFRTGIEHHQFKYAAARFEEAELVSPWCKEKVLACGPTYLGMETEGTTDVYERAVEALKRAGV